MTIEHLQQSAIMVMDAPYFWGSMGFTTAIAMFISALLYGGDVREANKGLVNIACYLFMVIWVNLIRIGETLSHVKNPSGNISNAYNGLMTIFFVTVFWVLGIFLGSKILKYRKKTHERSL